MNLEHLLQGQAEACTLPHLHIVGPHLQKNNFLGWMMESQRIAEGQKYITASNLAESQRGCKVRDGGGKKMERGKAHTVVGAAHHEEWRLEAHGEDWRRVEQQPSRTGEKRERAKQQQPGEEKRAAAARRGEESSSSQEPGEETRAAAARRGEESSSSQERRGEQQQPGEERRGEQQQPGEETRAAAARRGEERKSSSSQEPLVYILQTLVGQIGSPTTHLEAQSGKPKEGSAQPGRAALWSDD
jgi:hypothetical protein